MITCVFISLIYSLIYFNNLTSVQSTAESSTRNAELLQQVKSLFYTNHSSGQNNGEQEFMHASRLVDSKYFTAFDFTIAQQLRNTNNPLKLQSYSAFPFKTQYVKPLNSSFTKQAWDQLAKDPTTPYVQVTQDQKNSDTLIINYAIAQSMADSCLQCHNSHQQSVKKNWQANQLAIITVFSEQRLINGNALAFHLNLTLLLIGILLTIIYLTLLFACCKSNTIKKESLKDIKLLNDQLDQQTEIRKQTQILLNSAEEKFITENNKHEEDEKKLLEKQHNIYQLMAEIAHEIKTPLHAIDGHLQLMHRKSQILDTQKEPLEIIQTATDQLVSLCTDISQFANLETGNDKLKITNFNLIALCQNTLKLFYTTSENKQIELIFKTDIASQKLTVNGDAGKLKQILINLLSNAIKNTKAGKVVLALTILEDSVFCFQVIDTGSGLCEEQQTQIREVLSGTSNTIQSQYGNGLGLKIVYKCLKLMRSSILLESQQGTGSSFSFEVCLPIQSKALNFKTDSCLDLFDLANSDSPINLLIVDDIQLNRSILQQMLAPTSLTTFEANTGADALKIIRETDINLVLTDLLMPVMDGTKLLQQIKKTHPNLPVIAISASTLQTDPEYYLSIGFDNFIAKPFKIEKVCHLIAQTLNIQIKAQTRKHLLDEPTMNPKDFKLTPAYSQLIIEQCDLYLVREVEVIIERLSLQFPGNEPYFSQLQHFVSNYDLEGLTSFLRSDFND
jgi:signal transduction histidine kinase/CheY-like chemotaxis protein